MNPVITTDKTLVNINDIDETTTIIDSYLLQNKQKYHEKDHTYYIDKLNVLDEIELVIVRRVLAVETDTSLDSIITL